MGKLKVLALVGPTASGKTEIAIDVAKQIRAEIISVDSVSLYRGMDIGAAKPSLADRASVPHTMIDVADPSQSLSVADYQLAARAAIAKASSCGAVPFLVGGAGLYFRAVVDNLVFPGTVAGIRRAVEQEAEQLGPQAMHAQLDKVDPVAAQRIHPHNVRRTIRALEVWKLTGVPFSKFGDSFSTFESIYDLHAVGIELPREILRRRIDDRVDSMVEAGLVEETRRLIEQGLRDSLTSSQALGYAQMVSYLDGDIALDDAISSIKRATAEFARRQMTWFRRDPRIKWTKSAEEAKTTLLEVFGN